MRNVVLIGDSIFDNASYVAEGDSVIAQLSTHVAINGLGAVVPELLAVDGDVVNDVYDQLNHMPDQVSHIFLSIGGNDALRVANVLNQKVDTVADAMELFSGILTDFQARYRALLERLQAYQGQLFVCTVHDSVPDIGQASLTALALFNEVILKEAFAANVSVIDLRLICDERADYSDVSPIEPSKQGGTKIVKRLVDVIESNGQSLRPCVYS